MKRCLILVSSLSILCASCISEPHYRLDATAPFRVERSGRLMKVTPGLVGSPEAAFHDQAESLFCLDPWHFIWTPICTLWLAVSTPVYDVICLPRDLYLRNFAGLEVFVCHPDGTPIHNANVLACEIEGGIEREIGVFGTDSRGLAYIPRKSSIVRIKRVDFSDENSGDAFGMIFEKRRDRFGGNDDEDARVTIVRFESGTSYAPIIGTVDMAIPFDEKEKAHPWLVNVDLATANIKSRQSKPVARSRIDWAGRELVLDFPFDGGSFPFVMVDQTEEFRVSGSGSMAFLSEENKNGALSAMTLPELGRCQTMRCLLENGPRIASRRQSRRRKMVSSGVPPSFQIEFAREFPRDKGSCLKSEGDMAF